MRIFKLFALLTLMLTFSQVFACPTDIPSHIYYLKDNSLLKKIKKCTDVRSLDVFLKEKLELTHDHVIKISNLSNQSNTLELESSETLNLQCQNCDRLGNVTIHLRIKNQDKTSYDVWASGQILKRTKALVLKKQMGIYSRPLSKEAFQIQTIETLNPERLFFKREELGFYTLNQTISAGIPLEINHLRKLPLINSGASVLVFVENGPILIKKEVTSLGSGKIHEEIRLKESKSGKIFTAVVIDFNKALIKL